MMKVFLSWSGTRSEKVANLLKEWLPCVLQASEPWVSTSDIDRGAQWFNSIQGQLQDTTTGIICLTQENKERPWILFEAGALAKGLSDSRVCTLLIDLEPQHVRPPLGQFNHTQANRDDVFKLICTLNERLTKSLRMAIVKQVFDAQWPDFESKFNKILEETQNEIIGPKEPIRAQDDILAEILEQTRLLNNRLTRLEKNQSIQQDSSFIEPSVEYSMLTNDTRKKIILLAEEGLSAAEIGNKLGISHATVLDILSRDKNEKRAVTSPRVAVRRI
ncbi:hypothetical protein [Aeromonas veronii]|uniref:hypothetical protein n=1 Tax=Aeromonas veronii TaxID=654 RepID=UPI003B9E2F8D